MTKTLYQSWGFHLLFLYALSAAFSIVLSQIFLLLLLVFWLEDRRHFLDLSNFSFNSLSSNLNKLPKSLIYLYSPLITWLALAFYSAIAGIDPSHSLKEVFKTSIFCMLPLVIWDLFYSLKDKTEFFEKLKKILLAFSISFSLSSIHSVLSSSYGYELMPKIPGPVTESGQLALFIPLVISFLVYKKNSLSLPFLSLLFGLFSVLIFFSIPNALSLSFELKSALWIFLLLGTGFLAFKNVKYNKKLLAIVFCLCLAALLMNLKRGPWLGVFSASILIGLICSRKLAFLSIVLALSSVILITPIRERALQFSDHFSIEGGRKEIWRLGLELTNKYPLGIGLDNAEVIQKLEPTLPDSHRHMHNNLLNILVETGWLGLFIFCVWFTRIFHLGFIKNAKEIKEEGNDFSMLILALSAALLSWQVAGLVEYNFGDGEVRLLAFCIFGIMLAAASMKEQGKHLGKT